MKEYNFKRQKYNNDTPVFYTKLVVSFILYFVIIIVCNYNTQINTSIKDTLNKSYDFINLKNNCSIYINKVRDFLSEINDVLVMEE